MRIYQRLKRLIFGNILDCNYYHESGHAILAKLFDNIFEIEFVTLNKETSQNLDQESLGGLKGRIRRDQLSVIEYDMMIHIMLAGICAEDIYNSNGKIAENIYEIPIWAAKFNDIRYVGDVELVIGIFENIRNNICLEWQDYIIGVQKNLHQILNTNEVWDGVELIKDSLSKSSRKTLTGIELDELLHNSNFLRWKESNILDIINTRERLILEI